MTQVSIFIAALALVGCTPSYVQPLLPTDHPANPDATQASFVTPPDVLAPTAVDAVNAIDGMTDMAWMNHQSMADAVSKQPQDVSMATLPDAAAEPLKRLLEAYSAIGDQLASNAIDGVAEQAQLIGPALDALVKVEFPANLHFWHARDSDIRAIREMVQALTEISDLNVARTAYTVLSDALERVIAATGMPGGKTRPDEKQQLEHDSNQGGQR
ncbi:MAG: hypothetical protein BMS9Abin05_2464 [Rhodothermia bacterium]|nr:MAG: hypothetical protein BMS9Abin05_2464 [Rhodothermia bacterium]